MLTRSGTPAFAGVTALCGRTGLAPMTPSSRLTPYLYVLPLVALLAFVFGYPLVRIFEFSFKMVRGIDGPWIGLRNYQLILSQSLFWESVLHNLQLLLAIPVMVAISLLISVLLYERVAGWKIYRIIVFVPFVLAIPIVAVVMKRMFQFSGPVNEVLRWLSLDFMALDWIGSSDVALWTVMILIIWRESALGIILFLARLLSLDEFGRSRRRRSRGRTGGSGCGTSSCRRCAASSNSTW